MCDSPQHKKKVTLLLCASVALRYSQKAQGARFLLGLNRFSYMLNPGVLDLTLFRYGGRASMGRKLQIVVGAYRKSSSVCAPNV